MSDQIVDPARFRLRAFEADWNRLLATVLFSWRSELQDDPWRYRALASVLAAEADRWFQLGSETGYFAGADSLELGRGEVAEANLEFETASYFPSFGIPIEAPQFGEQLNLAWEDLTRDRIEFLSLLMFGSDALWSQNVGALEAFAEALEEQLLWQPPQEYLTMISWSLRGADSEAGSPGSPALWRLGDMKRYSFGPQPQWVEERLNPVDALLARIRRAVEIAAEAQIAGEDVGFLPRVREEGQG